MSWRVSRDEFRRRSTGKYDRSEVDAYDSLVGTLSADDEAAHLADLGEVFRFEPGMRVLDAGGGTGTVCKLLTRIEGLSVTALEPAPAMLAALRSKPALQHVRTVRGFCDAPEDRDIFEEATFDVIVSRQLGNVLFDPLAAFANWRHWLVPGGAVVVMDGLYERSAWSGRWEEEVDVLPLSVCRTMALIPYLLESSGYRIEVVQPMAAVGARPSTRTPRYVVVARAPS
jgi:SAM-dependent methyltransferase